MRSSRCLMSVAAFLVMFGAFALSHDARSWAQGEATCRDNYDSVASPLIYALFDIAETILIIRSDLIPGG